jgi:hypothetical protein
LFLKRKAEGSKAGKNLLNSMKTNPRIYFDKDGKSPNTLYIVCHSMGYAYALGMIEVLRGKLPFGSLYILAAENAGGGKVNIKEWQEVWQYGSDLGRNDGRQPDPDNKQDGVAPQTKAAGLLETQRVYIPYGQPKGFLQSHSVGNYGWIFSTNLKKGDPGYVNPR